MSEIHGDVEELSSIDAEMRRLRKRLRELGIQKKRVEARVLNYLKEKDHPGIKYKGTAIVAEDRHHRSYKKKSEKFKDGLSILEDYGVSDSKNVLDEVIEAMKGSPRRKPCLKLRKLSEY